MAARQDLARDLVDGKPVHLGRAGAGVAGQLALGSAEGGQIAAAHACREESQQNLAVGEGFGGWLGEVEPLEGIRRDEAVGPHGQTSTGTSTGMLFQPHWKLDGGRDADSATT